MIFPSCGGPIHCHRLVLNGTPGYGLECEAVTVGSAPVVVVWPKRGQISRALALLSPNVLACKAAMREPYSFEADRFGPVWVRGRVRNQIFKAQPSLDFAMARRVS
jgi:hypothetical protein